MATEVFQQNYGMLVSLIRIHRPTSLELRDLFLEPSGMGLTHSNPCESPTHRFPKSRPVTVRNSNGDSGVHRKWLVALQLQRTWDYWPCLLSRHNVAITVQPLATRTADPVCPYFQEPLYFHCSDQCTQSGQLRTLVSTTVLPRGRPRNCWSTLHASRTSWSQESNYEPTPGLLNKSTSGHTVAV